MMKVHNSSIKREDFLKDILIVLHETFEGPPEGTGSIYLDSGIGIFSTLETISYENASQMLNSSSIAAHTEHVKFYLDRLVEFIEGSNEKINWELSWLIETVDEKEWNILRQGLKNSYESVLRCFAEVKTWNQDNIGDAIAIIAHTAYHLGAIRQMSKNLQIN